MLNISSPPSLCSTSISVASWRSTDSRPFEFRYKLRFRFKFKFRYKFNAVELTVDAVRSCDFQLV